MKALFSLLLLVLILNFNSYAQTTKFNLGFEQNIQNNQLPDNWFKWGTYSLQKDSLNAHSGKYSSLINSGLLIGSFGSISLKIPAKYVGDSITLEGYMKTENIEDGFAGLLLRIDDNGVPIVFDNMQSKNITGTNNWARYTITLPYPEEAEDIYVAGILSGKGKAWFDDFKLSINGKDIQTLAEVGKEDFKAKLDKEFDEGSNFNLKQVSDLQINNLYKLGKIWGFLKYYHPEIAKGNVNWDYELFRILPKTNSKLFDKELSDWLQSYAINKNSARELNTNSSDIKALPDTKWVIDESFLSKNLCQELVKIKNSDKRKSNYYISFMKYVGNPVFKNENPYTNMKWDDNGYQLLALFRYWNMIEYFYPNKHLIEKNWDDVLKEYIPKVVLCNKELDYKLCILGLIAEIHDTHANIWQQDKVLNQLYGEKTAPLAIDFIENKPVIVKKFDQLNKNSNIKIGNIITHVNGVEVEKLVADKIKYCPASNYPTQLRDVSRRLLRTNPDSIILTLQNDSGAFTETINTVGFNEINIWKSNKLSHKTLVGDIGYIYPASLKTKEIDEIMKSFINKKAIIVDMRCYPSEFIIFSLGKYLMPQPVSFAKFSTGSLEQPGLFKFTDNEKVGENNKEYYTGKLIILINEVTQSQAEFTTMALRVSPNAKVIGSTTAGADGNVSSIILPGNIRTMISGIGVYYPNGNDTQRIGIIPDIEIKPTIKGIRNGKDELLDKAIELIVN